MSDTLPAWMRDHVRKCSIAFGIGHAGFLLYVRRVKDLRDGPALTAGQQVSGDSATSAHYRSATVRFAKQIPPHLRYEVVTHEMLHAAMGDLAEAADLIIAQLVPEAQRETALAIWHLGQEQTTAQLVRALAPVLQRMQLEEPE